MCYDCYGWAERARKRREFRQNHGGGPEELPHRKSPRKRIKRKPKVKKHKHDFIIYNEWPVSYYNKYEALSVRCLICGRWEYWKL